MVIAIRLGFAARHKPELGPERKHALVGADDAEPHALASVPGPDESFELLVRYATNALALIRFGDQQQPEQRGAAVRIVANEIGTADHRGTAVNPKDELVVVVLSFRQDRIGALLKGEPG